MDKKIEQLEKQIEGIKKTLRDLSLFFFATSIVFIGLSITDTKKYAVIHDYYLESLQNDQQTIQDLEKLQRVLEENQADASQHQIRN